MLQINQRIKNERVKAGLTEEEMAIRLSIPRSTYQYWEEKTPRPEKIVAVARALGLKDDYFFISNDEIIVSTDENGISIGERPVDPTLNKLAQALADQAATEKIRAKGVGALEEGFKTLAEAIKLQTELLQGIRQEMAREKIQLAMQSNLDEVRSIVDKISKGQDQSVPKIIKELDRLQGKNAPKARGKQKAENDADD